MKLKSGHLMLRFSVYMYNILIILEHIGKVHLVFRCIIILKLKEAQIRHAGDLEGGICENSQKYRIS